MRAKAPSLDADTLQALRDRNEQLERRIEELEKDLSEAISQRNELLQQQEAEISRLREALQQKPPRSATG